VSFRHNQPLLLSWILFSVDWRTGHRQFPVWRRKHHRIEAGWPGQQRRTICRPRLEKTKSWYLERCRTEQKAYGKSTFHG